MTFQVFSQALKILVSSIEELGAFVVSSLKKHTFSVVVQNHPKVQEVTDKNSHRLQKRIGDQLDEEKRIIAEIEKLLRSFSFPSSISVSNFPKFPEFPKEISVSNFPKFPEFPKEIAISNQISLDEVVQKYDEILKAIKSLRLNPTIKVESPKPERVIVPPPQVVVKKENVSFDKIADMIAQKIIDAFPKPQSLDYERLALAIKDQLVGISFTSGGGGKWAFKFANGDGGAAYINKNRQISSVQEDRWGLNHSEKIGSVTYTGEEDIDGNWVIRKITKTGGSVEMKYATKKNNPSVLLYENAWTNKSSLTYSLFREAFSLE